MFGGDDQIKNSESDSHLVTSQYSDSLAVILSVSITYVLTHLHYVDFFLYQEGAVEMEKKSDCTVEELLMGGGSIVRRRVSRSTE